MTGTSAREKDMSSYYGSRGVGQFLRERFPNTKTVVSECNKKLKGASTIRPEVPEGRKVPWSVIGTAIDLRIRYYFPGAKLTQWILLNMASQYFQNNPLMDEGEPGRFVERELVVDGQSSKEKIMVPLDAKEEEIDDYFRKAVVYRRNVLRLVDYFDAEVQRLNPAGRRLSYDEEDLLARHCYVLPLLNYHALPTSWSSFMWESKYSTAELLRSVEDVWVDDIRALSWAFYDRVFTDGWLSRPAVPNPRFDNGSSGDLIVDGCLVEIKTTKEPKLKREWLYQLLQYALLDREDRYGIREVGVYFTRQQEFVRWPIVDLMSALAEGDVPSLQAMRDACAAIISEKNPTVWKREVLSCQEKG